MNNSRMELHVTAYLEMLDIPYTGAGPKTIGITYGIRFSTFFSAFSSGL
jgi:hypothetical protein